MSTSGTYAYITHLKDKHVSENQITRGDFCLLQSYFTGSFHSLGAEATEGLNLFILQSDKTLQHPFAPSCNRPF